MRWWTNMRALVVTRSCSKFGEYCCRQHGAATWGLNQCRFGGKAAGVSVHIPESRESKALLAEFAGFSKKGLS